LNWFPLNKKNIKAKFYRAAGFRSEKTYQTITEGCSE